jgi:hypothetical protein
VVVPYGFGTPALPLAVFPGSAVFPRWTELKTVRFSASPLIEFRFRLGLCPVPPSSRPSARRWPKLLSWALTPLQHIQLRRSTLSRTLPARYVPPSGFAHPLGGLLPSKPGRLCFAPAALLGSSLRSVPPSRVVRAFPNGLTHLPFCPAVSPPRNAPARPDGSRFLSFAS